jgi:endoglycosylceramidase
VGEFGHLGRWITHPDGRIAVLRGLNVVNKVAPFHLGATGFDSVHAAFLQAQGFNSVRTAVIWSALEPEPGVFDDDYLTHVRDTIRLCHSHGLHVLLDFHQDMANERFGGHGWPGWAVAGVKLRSRPDFGFPWNYFVQPALHSAYDRFWANDAAPDGIGLQDHYAQAWRHVAEYLRDENGVVGYDLFNEPFPGSAWPRSFLPRAGCRFDSQLTEFHKRCLKAIRDVDVHRMVFYEPSILFYFGVNTKHDELGDPAVGFSFHHYSFVAAPGIPALPGPPQDWLGGRQERRRFALAESHSRASNAALVLSEWGGTDNLRATLRMARLCDEAMLSWHHWAYASCDMPQEEPEWGLLIDLARPPEGMNVKWKRLEALCRPFPRAVAGWPISWSFDEQTAGWIFDYRAWTSEEQTRLGATSGESSAAPRTEISVPSIRYPRGYQVRVRNGHVIDDERAWALQVESDPGVRVRVELTQGSRSQVQ